MALKTWMAAMAVAWAAGPVFAQQGGAARFTTAEEVGPILDATRNNWVAVREYDGKDWVYVTQLFSMRCAMIGIGVGINGQKPQAWPMPDCHYEYASPFVLLDDDPLPARSYPPGSIQQIDVLILMADGSTKTGTFSRAQVLIP
ncbi:MAG: hypothetical protein ACWA5A_14035 [Marinibacterium sp.]